MSKKKKWFDLNINVYFLFYIIPLIFLRKSLKLFDIKPFKKVLRQQVVCKFANFKYEKALILGLKELNNFKTVRRGMISGV